jgi:hypothetical protein
MNRPSRPGGYANVTATMALVVALGSATYAALSLPRSDHAARDGAIAATRIEGRPLPDAELTAGRLASGPAGTAIKARIVNAANVAVVALPPATTLVSFTADFPSVPAHGCIFQLVNYEPSESYLMPLWIDNYLPSGLVATNLRGDGFGASMRICNVTAGSVDPDPTSYNLLLVDRFTAQR